MSAWWMIQQCRERQTTAPYKFDRVADGRERHTPHLLWHSDMADCVYPNYTLSSFWWISVKAE